jgi:hypothetical protein
MLAAHPVGVKENTSADMYGKKQYCGLMKKILQHFLRPRMIPDTPGTRLQRRAFFLKIRHL